MSNKTLDKTIETAHPSVSDSKITNILFQRYQLQFSVDNSISKNRLKFYKYILRRLFIYSINELLQYFPEFYLSFVFFP